MPDERGAGWGQRMGRSRLARVLLIGVLILLLQVPIGLIHGVIGDRERTRDAAVAEVTGKWGRQQTLIGPAVVVPYLERWVETDKEGTRRSRSRVRHARFLPDALEVEGRLESEVRYRGIFEVPVYRMPLAISGRFARPDLSAWGVSPQEVLWDRAHLSLRIADVRAMQERASLSWGGAQVEFLPGAGEAAGAQPGIHAPLAGPFTEPAYDFHFELVLNGSLGVYFVPFGRDTRVALTSDWPDPSFQGAWLPTQRSVQASGFTAIWNIPFLGRSFPQAWRDDEVASALVDGSRFGVDLIQPVDQYRMALRSVKYQALILVLTFVVLWLFEVRAGLRIHAIQYLLLGAAMCLFYLLELALAEHIGFLPAFVAAAGAVVVLVAGYSAAVLASGARAVAVAGVLALLYGYLYVVLESQDYALLVGAVGLFVALAAVMFLTRRVDWYAGG